MFIVRKKLKFFENIEDKECRDRKITEDYLRIVNKGWDWNYRGIAC